MNFFLMYLLIDVLNMYLKLDVFKEYLVKNFLNYIYLLKRITLLIKI